MCMEGKLHSFELEQCKSIYLYERKEVGGGGGGGVITGFVHFKALTSTNFSLQLKMPAGFQAERNTFLCQINRSF